MSNKTPLVLLAALAALPSCALVAGGVAAVVITQEVMDNNTYVNHVNRDANQVWPTVKVFLADQSLDLIEVDDPARVATATIDNRKVTVSVETYDLDRSVVKVAASHFGVNDGEFAGIINERLMRRLESGG